MRRSPVAGPIDVVYYLVHAIGQPGFRDADHTAAGNVAAATKDANVRRIVYLGGFVPAGPDDGELSEHLTSRAEVAEALTVDGGPELVWLGAAVIFGAGSTSFEMMRYVGDRFPVIPIPKWMDNPIDPISIRDVLHYLVAAADAERGSARRLRHRRPGHHVVPRAAQDLCANLGQMAHRSAGAEGGHHGGLCVHRDCAAGARRIGRGSG